MTTSAPRKRPIKLSDGKSHILSNKGRLVFESGKVYTIPLAPPPPPPPKILNSKV